MEDRQQLFKKVIEAFKRHRFNRHDAQEYLNWIKVFLNHNQHRNPAELDAASVKEFLRYLCDDKGLMPSRQKQAYLAVNFFYNQVLRRNLWSSVKFDDVEIDESVLTGSPLSIGSELTNQDMNNRSSGYPVDPATIYNSAMASNPVDHGCPVWTRYLQEPYRLIAHVTYQCGLTLEEVLNLRVEDIELSKRHIRIRDAFGGFSDLDISDELFQPLSLQLKKALNTFQQDERQGNIYFKNPNALKRNQLTNNARWYFLFPGTLQFNLHTQKRIRDSLNLKLVEQAFTQARTQKSEPVTTIDKAFQTKRASL
ncbi:phage integrase N-terminal SAM-like domain-containing protein [Pleionea mediterranea]|uniref:Integrase-like protein n=1 Tax=Pleionea mediterranea TaxID=523701 RepID=A0A316FRM0_9GAMM|nr:phage integrase N-terminal SAM-like domain-containing protein [Pleionea mediterranea]PWK50822.1 integrase-like protein [Pleionea mediterranea]